MGPLTITKKDKGELPSQSLTEYVRSKGQFFPATIAVLLDMDKKKLFHTKWKGDLQKGTTKFPRLEAYELAAILRKPEEDKKDYSEEERNLMITQLITILEDRHAPSKQ